MPDEEVGQQVQEEDNAAQPQSDLSETNVDALLTEVAELRRQVAEVETAKEAERHRGRRFAVDLLIVLGCIVALVANLAFWMRGTVLNTNAWVATVAPLTQNEVIVNALSGYVVAEVFDVVEVEQVAQEILPAELGFLISPLSTALQDLIREAVATLVQSDQFNAAWVAVNRAVHGIFVSAMLGDGQYLYLKEGGLTVDLSGPFSLIEDRLGLGELGLFADEDWGKFVLLQNQQVAALQGALSTLNTVGLVLPIIAIVLLVAAWLLSLTRRRTLLWIGVGIAITMVITLLLLLIARPTVLAFVTTPLIRAIAGEIWNIVLRRFIIQTILVLIIGVLVAAGAALAGPHPRAVAIREGTRSQLARLSKQE